MIRSFIFLFLLQPNMENSQAGTPMSKHMRCSIGKNSNTYARPSVKFIGEYRVATAPSSNPSSKSRWIRMLSIIEPDRNPNILNETSLMIPLDLGFIRFLYRSWRVCTEWRRSRNGVAISRLVRYGELVFLRKFHTDQNI